jgi:putative membrane protein
MVVEMWFWDKPKGLKMFNMEKEFATSTKVLAANQGLYNGFLASGLLWGLLHNEYLFGLQIQLFFLSCIFAAGIYGATSTSKIKILYVQSLPAVFAVICVAFRYYNFGS